MHMRRALLFSFSLTGVVGLGASFMLLFNLITTLTPVNSTIPLTAMGITIYSPWWEVRFLAGLYGVFIAISAFLLGGVVGFAISRRSSGPTRIMWF